MARRPLTILAALSWLVFVAAAVEFTRALRADAAATRLRSSQIGAALAAYEEADRRLAEHGLKIDASDRLRRSSRAYNDATMPDEYAVLQAEYTALNAERTRRLNMLMQIPRPLPSNSQRVQWRAMVMVAALFLPLAHLFVRHWERQRAAERQKAGRCPACGYDLRATPGRCPECGAVPEGSG